MPEKRRKDTQNPASKKDVKRPSAERGIELHTSRPEADKKTEKQEKKHQKRAEAAGPESQNSKE